MGSMNKAIVIGNLGKDAEMRYTQGGTAVATFSVATTETWKDREGQKKEDTQWHRIVLWGKTAEALQEFLTKGKQVCVEGKLQTRKWTDRNGAEKYTTEIRADRIVLLGGGGNRSGGERRRERHVSDEEMAGDGYAAPDESPAPAEDDIPF